jgi:hypothetical protein
MRGSSFFMNKIRRLWLINYGWIEVHPSCLRSSAREAGNQKLRQDQWHSGASGFDESLAD